MRLRPADGAPHRGLRRHRPLRGRSPLRPPPGRRRGDRVRRQRDRPYTAGLHTAIAWVRAALDAAVRHRPYTAGLHYGAPRDLLVIQDYVRGTGRTRPVSIAAGCTPGTRRNRPRVAPAVHGRSPLRLQLHRRPAAGRWVVAPAVRGRSPLQHRQPDRCVERRDRRTGRTRSVSIAAGSCTPPAAADAHPSHRPYKAGLHCGATAQQVTDTHLGSGTGRTRPVSIAAANDETVYRLIQCVVAPAVRGRSPLRHRQGVHQPIVTGWHRPVHGRSPLRLRGRLLDRRVAYLVAPAVRGRSPLRLQLHRRPAAGRWVVAPAVRGRSPLRPSRQAKRPEAAVRWHRPYTADLHCGAYQTSQTAPGSRVAPAALSLNPWINPVGDVRIGVEMQ